MTSVNPNVDLGTFTRPVAAPRVARPRRRWLRIVVPAVLLLGFAAVLALSVGDVFTPVVEVTLARPAMSEGVRESGTTLFQAAGWVEPDPFPVRVTPLASGIVAEVLVQQSDRVERDQPVAKLVEQDAQLALAAAEAALARVTAERDKAAAESETAARSLEAALDVTEALAMARAEGEGRAAEAENRKAAIRKGEAQVKLAGEELELQRWLASEKSAGPRQVEIAAAKLEEAQGELSILASEAALAAAEAKKAQARLARAEKDFDLRFEQRLRASASKAAWEASVASVRDAEVKRDEAKLRLERMTVRAPVAGVVLQRFATPGMKVSTEGAEPTAVCALFDPASVRIRVDIPQEQVGKAMPGQEARIFSEARRDRPYRGEVLRIVQEADINKVTLQAHVRVLDPDDLLRPEMLCQVRFLSRGAEAGGAPPSAGVKAPARLLVDGDSFWIVDPVKGTAAKRRVQVASGGGGEWVEVVSGLNLSDKLIDEGRAQLREGARIRAKEAR